METWRATWTVLPETDSITAVLVDAKETTELRESWKSQSPPVSRRLRRLATSLRL